jgi:predicted alpha/beta superfamily hydrolase
VYTPPSYEENTFKTISQILIMHDGQNLFNASTSFGGVAWNCQYTVDELVVEGAMQEILIVGVDNTIDRINEYTYSKDPTVGEGGKGNIYLDFLVDTVVPFIQVQCGNFGFLFVPEQLSCATKLGYTR